MVDPITVAITSTTIASIEGGVSLLQLKKTKQLEKEIKRQRFEIAVTMGGLIAAIVASAIDSRLIKQKCELMKNDTEYKISMLHDRLDAIEQRIAASEMRLNSINLDALNAKLDMVVAATATPLVIPKREDIIKKEDKEGD